MRNYDWSYSNDAVRQMVDDFKNSRDPVPTMRRLRVSAEERGWPGTIDNPIDECVRWLTVWLDAYAGES